MMGEHALRPLFRPRSVAVLGASSDPEKIGGRPLAFLKRAGFGGVLVPVNPRGGEIQGLTAVSSLREVAGKIEHAIIALPGNALVQALADCREAGVRVAQVYSSLDPAHGTADSGALIRRFAENTGIRVLGPNCLGLFCTEERFFGTFATALDGAWPRSGGVGIATQSGAMGSYFFGLAEQRGLGFSIFVSTGNEADLSIADCVDYLVADAATRVILLAMEGCRDGARLMAALSRARELGKPVIALKVGRSVAGSRAALTHTGALVGDDRMFDAIFEASGTWRAATLEAAVDAAYLASQGPLPEGRRLAVVTTSGGIGVMLADAAEQEGLELPPLPPASHASIRECVPLAIAGNPLDTSTGILANPKLYADLASRMLDAIAVDAVVCFLSHLGRNPQHWKAMREALFALRARFPTRPFLAVLLAGDDVRRELEEAGFAVFQDPACAVAALGACCALQTSPPVVDPVTRTQGFLDGELAHEADASTALAALGIPFPARCFATDPEEAAEVAQLIGFPVVLKVVSPDIPHKSDVGGVIHNLYSAAAIRNAAERMLANIRDLRPHARIVGLLVARQMHDGVELLVGTQCDPVFGPMITVGAGGNLSEFLDDTVSRPAPVNKAQALAMLDHARIARLLGGWRGRPAVDRDALGRLIARVSEIACDNATRVSAIELNPVLAREDGAWALDALVQTSGDKS